MGEDELRMLIHLAISLVRVEQKTNERLDKLEQTAQVLHNNNATMSALLNDLLEQGRTENGMADRLLAVEARLVSLSNDLNLAFGLVNTLNAATIKHMGGVDVTADSQG